MIVTNSGAKAATTCGPVTSRAPGRCSCQALPAASITWGPDVAQVYDATSAAMFDPTILGPAVALTFDIGQVRSPATLIGERSLPGGSRGFAAPGQG
jgi:hypothetical protein